MKLTIKKVKTDDLGFSQFQDGVRDAVQPVLDAPIWQGNIVEGVVLYPGQVTRIAHGLGRRYMGWLLINSDAPCRPYTSGSFDPNKHVGLTSADQSTISVYVF
jgi:hypothetical protein